MCEEVETALSKTHSTSHPAPQALTDRLRQVRNLSHCNDKRDQQQEQRDQRGQRVQRDQREEQEEQEEQEDDWVDLGLTTGALVTICNLLCDVIRLLLEENGRLGSRIHAPSTNRKRRRQR